MEIKYLLLGTAAVGGVCAGGYLLSRGGGGSGSKEQTVKLDGKIADSSGKNRAEPPAVPQLQPTDSSPAPRESIVGDSRHNPYEANTLGALFSRDLMEAQGDTQNVKWQERGASIKGGNATSKLFSRLKSVVDVTKDLKTACQQMYTTKRVDWEQNTVNHATGKEEKKTLFNETWKYCSVSGNDKDQPNNWPSKTFK